MYITTRTTSVGGQRIAPLSSPHKAAIATAIECSRHLLSRTECLPRGCIAREVGWTLPVTSLRRITRDINVIATATCCERLRDRDFPYISRSHSSYCLVPAITLHTSRVLTPGVRRIVPTVLQDHGAPRYPSSIPLLGLEPLISAHSRFPRAR